MASDAALRASIKEKKAELAALEQLRDQSAALVGHLEAMKGKFGELKDGTAGEPILFAAGARKTFQCEFARRSLKSKLAVASLVSSARFHHAVAADVLARWSELFALVAARDSHRLVLVPQPTEEETKTDA